MRIILNYPKQLLPQMKIREKIILFYLLLILHIFLVDLIGMLSIGLLCLFPLLLFSEGVLGKWMKNQVFGVYHFPLAIGLTALSLIAWYFDISNSNSWGIYASQSVWHGWAYSLLYLSIAFTGIYYTHSREAQKWARVGFSLTLAALCFQIFPVAQRTGADYIVLIVGVLSWVPLLWPPLASYHKRLAKYFLKTKSAPTSKKVLLDLLLSKALRLKTKVSLLEQVSNQDHLMWLARHDKIDENLHEHALKKIQSPGHLTQILIDSDLKTKWRLQAIDVLNDQALFEQVFAQDENKEIRLALIRRISIPEFQRKVLEDDELSDALRIESLSTYNAYRDDYLKNLYNSLKDEKVALKVAILDFIEDSSFILKVFTDVNEPTPCRIACAEKIKDEQVLFDVFTTGQKEHNPLREETLRRIKNVDHKKAILLDTDEDEDLRKELVFEPELSDYFEVAVQSFTKPEVIEEIAKNSNKTNIFGKMLGKNRYSEPVQEVLCRHLFKLDFPDLSPVYIRYLIKYILPDVLAKKDIDSSSRLLRTLIAWYGQSKDRGILEKLLPFPELKAWQNYLIAHRVPIEEDEWMGLTSRGESLNQLHWAMAHLWAIFPSADLTEALKKILIRLDYYIRKRSQKNIPGEHKPYEEEIVMGALLYALGRCISIDPNYKNFKKDHEILETISLKEERQKDIRKQMNQLIKKRQPYIYQLNATNEWDHSMRYRLVGKIREIDQELKVLSAQIEKINVEIKPLTHQLSAGNYLMRISGDSQSYIPYIRQHAGAGLRALLQSAFLEDDTKEKIEERLAVIFAPIPEVEKQPEGLLEEEEATVSLEELMQQDPEELLEKEEKKKEGDPNMHTWQVRLLPHGHPGELVYLLEFCLKELEPEGNIDEYKELNEIVDELCNSIPDAITFLQKYPLRLMPKTVKLRLGDYRERGYEMLRWTRYVPPLNIGEVIERYLEVRNFSEPNSLGIVHWLFKKKLWALPVIYHEHLHAGGIKNEAHVWLKEHFFLRYLIAKDAPESADELPVYHKHILKLFGHDPLSLALLNSKLEDLDFVQCLNRMILVLYGQQLNPIQARRVSRHAINNQDVETYIYNLQQHWDSHKPWPYLQRKEGAYEREQLEQIIVDRKTQKNVITPGEHQGILHEVTSQHFLQAWQEYCKRLGPQGLWAFPDLCTLIQHNPPSEDLAVFKG